MKNLTNLNHLEKEVKNINYFFSEWKLWEEKKDYKISFVDEKNTLRSIKSEITINKPLKTVYNYTANLENKVKYDKNYDSGHTIQQINDNYLLQYQKYKGKLGVSPRDFIVVIKKLYVKNII